MLIDLKPKSTTIPFQTVSVLTLARYCKNIADRTQFCKVAVIGSQGTGKTSCTVNILKWLNKITNNDIVTIYARGSNILSLLIDIEKTAEVLYPYTKDKKYIVLFLDDFSYVLETTSEIRNIVKHNYTRLRHVFKNKYLLSFMTIHYKKAVQPLLRDTYLRVYTHMNSDMLIEFKNNYKFFIYAKNYIKYINRYYIEHKRFVFESIPDETIKIAPSNSSSSSSDNKYKIESISLDNKSKKYNDNTTTAATTINLTINDDNERLAILDMGTDCKYLYYNIVYNSNSEFELDNVCIVTNNTNNNNSNESFSLAYANNVHVLASSDIMAQKEEEATGDNNNNIINDGAVTHHKPKAKISQKEISYNIDMTTSADYL